MFYYSLSSLTSIHTTTMQMLHMPPLKYIKHNNNAMSNNCVPEISANTILLMYRIVFLFVDKMTSFMFSKIQPYSNIIRN